jgi:hypothetical protein
MTLPFLYHRYSPSLSLFFAITLVISLAFSLSISERVLAHQEPPVRNVETAKPRINAWRPATRSEIIHQPQGLSGKIAVVLKPSSY